MKKSLFLLVGALFLACNSDDPQGLTEACDTPVGLSAQATATDRAVLGWSQSGANLFRVEYGEAGFNIGSGVQRTTTETALEINGLIAGTAYQFYVQADCGQFQSNRNGPLLFETPPCPEVTGIEVPAMTITATQASVNWDQVGATQYEVEYGEAGFALGDGTRSSSAFPQYPLNNLTPETNYEVYVRSVCGSSNSLFSGPVAFTTKAVGPAPLSFQ